MQFSEKLPPTTRKAAGTRTENEHNLLKQGKQE